jgi:proline iminopeptidase
MRTRRSKAALHILIALAVSAGSCSTVDVRMGVGKGDGVRLSYRVVGQGEPLVVIHDGPGYEKTMMYEGFDSLAERMKVIYYDQRGCGDSEPLSPLTPVGIADNVNDLEALRTYLHLGKISIAAHGWGAIIALEYARKFTMNVDSVILITPISPFAPDERFESILERLPKVERDHMSETLKHPLYTTLDKREQVMRRVIPHLFHRKEAANGFNLTDLKISPDVNIRLGGELKSLDMFSVLDDVAVPVLVIIGRHDISTTVRDQMAYVDGINTASVIVFNGSGHFPFLEEPDIFANVATEYLLERRLPALVRANHGW